VGTLETVRGNELQHAELFSPAAGAHHLDRPRAGQPREAVLDVEMGNIGSAAPMLQLVEVMRQRGSTAAGP
jgi:hypothetical protein